MPNHTIPDPLQVMLDQHVRVSEWLHMLKSAAQSLDMTGESIDYAEIQRFFQ